MRLVEGADPPPHVLAGAADAGIGAGIAVALALAEKIETYLSTDLKRRI